MTVNPDPLRDRTPRDRIRNILKLAVGTEDGSSAVLEER